MPKLVRKLERGFIDPLSLFGLLFLVVTLGALTYVTANPNIRQLIGSSAKFIENGIALPTTKNTDNAVVNLKSNNKTRVTDNEETSSVANPAPAPTPITPVTVPATAPVVNQPTNPQPGEFGYEYPGQMDNGLPFIAGTYVYNGKRYLVASPGTAAAAFEYYKSNPDKIVSANFSDTTKKELNLDAILQASNQTAPTTPTTTMTAQEIKEFQLECTSSGRTFNSTTKTCTPKSTATTQTQITSLTAQDKKIAAQDCTSAGGTYYSVQNACIKASASQTVKETNEGLTTFITTVYTDVNTGKIIDKFESSRPTADASNRIQYNDPLKKTEGEACNFASDCGSGKCERQGASYINRCVPAEDKSTKQQVYDFTNKITFGGFGTYVDAYNPNKVTYTWEVQGYKSKDDCVKNQNNYLIGNDCMTPIYTKEQVTSSIKLGATITAEGAALFYALPAVITSASTITAGTTILEGISIVGAPAMTSFGAVSTFSQTSNAVIAQINDPGFFREDIAVNGFLEAINPETYLTDAGNQTAMAALSWANLGTADKLIQTFGALEQAGVAASPEIIQAAQSARNINNVVSLVNFGVDAPNAINTCSQDGLLTGSCGFAASAAVLDVGFGLLDYHQGQLGFGNPLAKIKAPSAPVNALIQDIPNPNETRIATPAEIEQVNQLINQPFSSTPVVIDVGGQAKFAAPTAEVGMIDILAEAPKANVSSILSDANNLLSPSINQDPKNDFGLGRPDSNQENLAAKFKTDAISQDPTINLLLPSSLDNQIPNTPQHAADQNLANVSNPDLPNVPAAPSVAITDDLIKKIADKLPNDGGSPQSIINKLKAEGVSESDITLADIDRINQVAKEGPQSILKYPDVPQNKPDINTSKDIATGQNNADLSTGQVKEPTNSTSWLKEKVTDPLIGFLTGNPLPKSLDNASITQPKPFGQKVSESLTTIGEKMIGQLDEVSIDKLGTGAEIKIKPGDTIETANIIDFGTTADQAQSIANTRNTIKIPEDATWKVESGDTGNVYEGNTTDGFSFPKETHQKLTITYPDGKTDVIKFWDSHISLTRANPEPGLLSLEGIAKTWDGYVTKPLGDLIFGNPLPKSLDTGNLSDVTRGSFNDIPFSLRPEPAPELIAKVSETTHPKIMDDLIEFSRKNGGSTEGMTSEYNGRMWSVDYNKTSKGFEEFKKAGGNPDDLVRKIDSGVRGGNEDFLFSAKERGPVRDHISYPDLTGDRTTSFNRMATFLDGNARVIISQEFAKVGITMAPEDVALSDFFWASVGPETKIKITKVGDALIQEVGRPIEGTLLSYIGDQVPPSKTGGDYYNILEYKEGGTPDVSYYYEPKKTNLTANVLKKGDPVLSGPVEPKYTRRTTPSADETNLLASTVNFDTSLTPKDIAKLVGPEQGARIGIEPVDVPLRDAPFIEIKAEVGDGKIEIPLGQKIDQVAADATGFSVVTTEAQTRFGDNSPEVAGIQQLRNRYFSQIVDGAANNKGRTVRFAGDGAEIVFLEGVTPKALAELLELNKSFKKNITNALNGVGGYSDAERAAAKFLNENFKDQFFVKVAGISSDATLTVHESNGAGYKPIEITTKVNADDYLKNSKKYKFENGVDSTVISVSPELVAKFKPAELKKAGLYVINDPNHGTFLGLLEEKPSVFQDIWSSIKKFFTSPIPENGGALNATKLAQTSADKINQSNPNALTSVQNWFTKNVVDKDGVFLPGLFGPKTPDIANSRFTNNDVPNIIFEQTKTDGGLMLKIEGKDYPITSVADAQTKIKEVTGRDATINPETGVVKFTEVEPKIPVAEIPKDVVPEVKTTINSTENTVVQTKPGSLSQTEKDSLAIKAVYELPSVANDGITIRKAMDTLVASGIPVDEITATDIRNAQLLATQRVAGVPEIKAQIVDFEPATKITSPIVRPEVDPNMTTTEKEVKDIVNKMDSWLTESYSNGENIIGCRGGLCGNASEYGSLAADATGDLKPTIYQLRDLNKERGVALENSFGHTVIVVEDSKGNKFLVDTTFNQFVHPSTGIVMQNNKVRNVVSGTTKGNPIVDKLLRDGYVPLTDESLTAYLNAASSGPNKPAVTLDLLDKVKPSITVKFTPEEYQRLYPELIISKPELVPPAPLAKPKTTIFGYEYNGFKNEDGKFTLWPFEKPSAPTIETPKVTILDIKPDTNLGYEDITKSPLFTNDHLNVKGEVVTPEKVANMIQNLCKQLPAACKDGLLSPVYHGSSSTSLYGLLQNDATPLKSLSELTNSGEPVFSEASINGLLDRGTASDTGGTGIISISAIDPNTALEYSRPVSFDPQRTTDYLAELKNDFNTSYAETIQTINSLNIPSQDKQSITDYFKSTLTYNQPQIEKTASKVKNLLNSYENSPKLPAIENAVAEARQGLFTRNSLLRTIDLTEKQLASYPKLEPWKRDLLDNSFPVVYGIKPEIGHQSIFMSGSDVELDMGFGKGFKLSEIENVFVPKSEIPRIEKLWAELHPNQDMPFKLADIDTINPKAEINKTINGTNLPPPTKSKPTIFGYEWNGFRDENGGFRFPIKKVEQTEKVLDDIVSTVNNVIDESIQKHNEGEIQLVGYTPELGCKSGLCHLASEDVALASVARDLDAVQYQVADLNETRGVDRDNSFAHAITIVTDKAGERYLIDTTFVQFVDPTTGNIRHPVIGIVSNQTVDSSLVQQILKDGYFKLTDSSMNEYLNLMTSRNVETPTSSLQNILDNTNNGWVPDFTIEEIKHFTPKLAPINEQPTKPTLFGIEWNGIRDENGKLQFPIDLGVKFNGFKNEDGKFTLWPFEKQVSSPKNIITKTEIYNLNVSDGGSIGRAYPLNQSGINHSQYILDPRVSPKQIRVEVRGYGVYITSLDATAKTSINNRALEFEVPTLIKEGDLISLTSGTTLKYNGIESYNAKFELINSEQTPKQSLIERLITGSESKISINQVNNGQPLTFHPGDELISTNGVIEYLPQKITNNKNVYYQITTGDINNLEDLTPIPLQDVNYLPNLETPYRISFGTLENGIFQPLNDSPPTIFVNVKSIIQDTPISQELISKKPSLLQKFTTWFQDTFTKPVNIINNNVSQYTTISKTNTEIKLTPEFKQWFGDGYLVNKAGEPIILYHGTTADFSEFDLNYAGKTDPGFYSRAIYLAPDVKDAEAYAGSHGASTVTGGNIRPVYANIKNPYIPEDLIKFHQDFGNYREEGIPQKITDALKKAGYDSVIVYKIDPSSDVGAFLPGKIIEEVAVFDTANIKSTFDSDVYVKVPYTEPTHLEIAPQTQKSKPFIEYKKAASPLRDNTLTININNYSSTFSIKTLTPRDYAILTIQGALTAVGLDFLGETVFNQGIIPNFSIPAIINGVINYFAPIATSNTKTATNRAIVDIPKDSPTNSDSVPVNTNNLANTNLLVDNSNEYFPTVIDNNPQNVFNLPPNQVIYNALTFTINLKNNKTTVLSFPAGSNLKVDDIRQIIQIIEKIGGLATFLPNINIIKSNNITGSYKTSINSIDPITGEPIVTLIINPDFHNNGVFNYAEAIGNTIKSGSYGPSQLSTVEIAYHNIFLTGKGGSPGNYFSYDPFEKLGVIHPPEVSNSAFGFVFAEYLTDPTSLKTKSPAEYAFFDAVYKGYDPLDIQFVNQNGSVVSNFGSIAIIQNKSNELEMQNQDLMSKTWNDISPNAALKNKGYESIVEAMSKKYGVPIPVIVGIMENESGAYNNRETYISNDGYGSVGLMQVIPGGSYTASVLKNPNKNIEAGTSLLKAIFENPALGNGNWRDTIALYNTGDWNTLLNKPIISIGGYVYADSVLSSGGIDPNDIKTGFQAAPKANKPFNNSLVDNFSVFMQTTANIGPINKSGDTMLKNGCAPSTAYNILTLAGQNPDIHNIVNNFYWNCDHGCQTSGDAVLQTLQQNGFDNAVDYGEHNKITDATLLQSYTGTLVYGGTVSSPNEVVSHVAAFNCQNGSCVTIDSYFGDGKPVACEVKNSTTISCGSYTYHVGNTQGIPDALFPIQTQ